MGVQTGWRCHGNGGAVLTVATNRTLQTGSISWCVNGPACINMPGNYFIQINPQLTFIGTILIHQKKERCRRIKAVHTINSPGTSKDIKVSCKDFLKIQRTIHFQKCLECESVVLPYHFSIQQNTVSPCCCHYISAKSGYSEEYDDNANDM